MKLAYASGEDIRLYRIINEDRNDYETLRRQLADSQVYYDDREIADALWDNVLNGKDETYVIRDIADNFCGVIILQNPIDETPEIVAAKIKENM